MKSFKVLIAALALAIAGSASLAQAQEKKGRGNMTPEQRIERIETAVGTLTAEQKKKITDIYAKSAEKIAGATQENRGEIMQAINKEIRAVLTPEQQKKFDEMPQGGRGGGGGKKKDK
jgi:Spy/CpxP family protein refolding chaperone